MTRYEFPDTHTGNSWYTINELTSTDSVTTTHSGAAYDSSFATERGLTDVAGSQDNSAGTITYTSYAWFLDDESYEYPYCKTEHTYYDYTQLDDHNSTYDMGYDCPIYEHNRVNYRSCTPNYPGFISPTDSDTPTEEAIDSGNERLYFSELEYDEHGENTQITLRQCP